jgi:hypothetical protein
MATNLGSMMSSRDNEWREDRILVDDGAFQARMPAPLRVVFDMERVLYNVLGRTDLQLKLHVEQWEKYNETLIVVSARMANGNVHRLSCRQEDFPSRELITKLQVMDL